jgi:hypothetical protein
VTLLSAEVLVTALCARIVDGRTHAQCVATFNRDRLSRFGARASDGVPSDERDDAKCRDVELALQARDIPVRDAMCGVVWSHVRGGRPCLTRHWSWRDSTLMTPL